MVRLYHRGFDLQLHAQFPAGNVELAAGVLERDLIGKGGFPVCLELCERLCLGEPGHRDALDRHVAGHDIATGEVVRHDCDGAAGAYCQHDYDGGDDGCDALPAGAGPREFTGLVGV